jgi:hypothetical protein
MFVSVVGDVDADGIPDVYASDWMDATHGPVTGRIYVHCGRDGGRLLTVAGERAGEGFGIGPARAGDVDGDGGADLVIGAWQHGGAAHSGGRIHVVSGRDGSTLATYTGRIPGETLGFDADGMGDVDGDGAADFLVTSAWSLVNGVRSGRAMVLSGARLSPRPRAARDLLEGKYRRRPPCATPFRWSRSSFWNPARWRRKRRHPTATATSPSSGCRRSSPKAASAGS